MPLDRLNEGKSFDGKALGGKTYNAASAYANALARICLSHRNNEVTAFLTR